VDQFDDDDDEEEEEERSLFPLVITIVSQSGSSVL